MTATEAQLPRMRRWSAAKLSKELAFADDNGGDPNALAWIAALKAEAARREGILNAPLEAQQDLEDFIADALQDSMDVDWTCRTGAAYVVEALFAAGLVKLNGAR